MASGKPDTARTVPWGRPEMLPAEMRAGTGTEVPQPSAAPHPTSNSLRRLIAMEARRLCGPPWIHISNSLREYLSMAEPLTEDELPALEGDTRPPSLSPPAAPAPPPLPLPPRALDPPPTPP